MSGCLEKNPLGIRILDVKKILKFSRGTNAQTSTFAKVTNVWMSGKKTLGIRILDVKKILKISRGANAQASTIAKVTTLNFSAIISFT